jgi:hypothetical protein
MSSAVARSLVACEIITIVDNTTRIQLELISEVSTLLTAADVEHCLVGGWALDFLAGRVTRAHYDVDVLVWTKDIEKIHHPLTLNGYAYKQDYPYPEEGAFFCKHEQWIDCTFLELDERGDTRLTGRFRDWALPQTCFTRTNALFEGVECPVLHKAGQIQVKAELRQYFPDWPERQKDIDDLALLRQLAD